MVRAIMLRLTPLVLILLADVLDNVNPDLSDSEYIDREEANDAPTPGFFGGSEAGDMPTPGADLGDGEGDHDEGDEDEEEGDIDEDLAAELDMALGDEMAEEDEDEEDEESEEEEEDDDDDETAQAKRLLNEEIRDLEAAVTKKNHEIASSANPLIRVRLYSIIMHRTHADNATSVGSRTLCGSYKQTWTPGLPKERRWKNSGSWRKRERSLACPRAAKGTKGTAEEKMTCLAEKAMRAWKLDKDSMSLLVSLQVYFCDVPITVR